MLKVHPADSVIEENIDKRLRKILKKELEVEDDAIYKINGPLDLTFLMKLYGFEGFEHLKDKPFTPQQPKMIDPDRNLFEQIREKDLLLFHPYESFDPIVQFVRMAAKDPDVLAIKQTLYRVSSNSPIIS